MIKKAMILVGALAVSACATAPELATQTPADQPPKYYAARDFIVGGTFPADFERFPVRGCVIFTKEDSKKRQKRVCRAFVRLPTTHEITNYSPDFSVSDDEVAATYWPLKANLGDQDDCDQMRDQYDYGLSRAFLSTQSVQQMKGPLIVGEFNGAMAVVDLSDARKSYINALIPAWANALVANGHKDITVKGGLVTNFCEVAADKNMQDVPVEVLRVINVEKSLFEQAAAFAYGFVSTLLPGGARIEKLASGTCDEILERGLAGEV